MAAVCCVGEAGEAGERSRVALVTGATGFVGGHLVRRLRADGWTVFSVVRRASDDPSAHHHDGTTESLSRIVTSVRPDVVFHLASRFVAEHGESDVESLVRDNILFGAQLLETLQAAGCSALVNVGSAWQHFGNAEYSPTSLYAATKQAFLDIAEYYVAAQGLRMVTVEFTDTYGPADTRRKLIPVMLGAERSGTELQMVGDEMMR
jgi:nucleoside-diphosphate-sugar epimerase